MADSVNSSLLSVARADSPNLSPFKSAQSAAKSSENNDFSRVLDRQQSRDRAAEKSSDASTDRREPSGKSLPPEGNRAAEAATDGAIKNADTEAAAGGQVAGVNADANETAANTRNPGADPDVTSDSLAASSALPEGVRQEISPMGVRADIGAASDAVSTLPKTEAGEVQLSASGTLATTHANTLADDPANNPVNEGSPLPMQADVVAKSPGAGPAPESARKSENTSAVALSQTAGELSPEGGESLSEDADGVLPAKTVSLGETLQKRALGDGDARSVASSGESTTANRSTSDWLRAGMGSDNIGQRGIFEFQADGSGEFPRGATVQRLDGQAAALATSTTVAGLTPTTTASTVASTAAPAAALPEYSLARAPDEMEFPGELTARMKTLVRDGVREARLQLHPAELGRLQVTVTTEGDQTKVAFTAETTAARDAIEQSMPRLREMLEQSGLQLAQSDVGQREPHGEAGRGERGELAEAQQAGSEASDTDSAVLVAAGVSRSRIDTYI